MSNNQTPPAATDYSGVREYVGARYVPVFANPAEWTDTRGYEPLTIVLHEGNSYTSTQYVPVGADIDNTKYWQQTGNWNAQIEAYRKDVLAYHNDVLAYRNDVLEYHKEFLAVTKKTALMSLEAIGGKANDPTFDNASVIESWLSEGEVSKILYVPDGEWYINHTLNLSNTSVICDGYFKCSANFNATPYVSVSETVNPAIVIGTGEEGSYTFDNDYDTFLKNSEWNVNVDCNLQNLTGVVVHRTWNCSLTLNIHNALEYGVYTGRYITESKISASVYIMGQHGTNIVGKAAFVSRSSDYVIDKLITMHYMCGIDIQAPNITLNYWHGYGYYDVAKEGVGIRLSTEGNVTIGDVFNDGCQYCFDFTANWCNMLVNNYIEIGRTPTNQLYLIKNWDATRHWLVIDNFAIERQDEENTVKDFLINYLAKNITTHHAGPIFSHLVINNMELKRRIVFNSTADSFWGNFDAWKLPVTNNPLVTIMGNNTSFTKEVLNAHHIYGQDGTAIYSNTIGRFTVCAKSNWTSFSTSDVGVMLEIFGLNQELTNNVTSVGGEGSTNVNIVVQNVPATYSTINL